MGAGLDLVTGQGLVGGRDRRFLWGGLAEAWLSFARWLTS